MSIKYCPSCQRNVNTEHSWNTGALVFLLLFAFPIGLIYLAVRWKRRCPICHSPESFLMAPWFTTNTGTSDGTNYTMTQPPGANWTETQPPQQGRYP